MSLTAIACLLIDHPLPPFMHDIHNDKCTLSDGPEKGPSGERPGLQDKLQQGGGVAQRSAHRGGGKPTWPLRMKSRLQDKLQ